MILFFVSYTIFSFFVLFVLSVFSVLSVLSVFSVLPVLSVLSRIALSCRCKLCPIGFYNPFPEPRNRDCYSCLTARRFGENDCEGCDPGRFKVDISHLFDDGTKGAECHQCPSGWFSAKQNVVVCKECPSGFYTNDIPSPNDGIIYFDRCSSCGRGKHGTKTKAINETESCAKCPSGQYSEMEGIASVGDCIGCPSGRWSSGIGIKQESKCRLNFRSNISNV